MCEWNKQENRILGLPLDEKCSFELLGIQCKPTTIKACQRAEICLACQRKDCKGCENL